MAKDIKKRAENEMAVFNYEGHEGAGYENQTQDDRALPFFNLLNALSPQINKQAQRIDGAEIGMFVNTLTKELIPPTGVDFVVALTEHCYVEWKKDMGGFVGRHDIRSPVVTEAKEKFDFGAWETPSGNDLIETFYMYSVVCHEDGRLDPVVIPITGTKIKTYKQICQRLNMHVVSGPDGRKIRPPIYSHLLHISSFDDSRGKNEFKNIAIRFAVEDAPNKSLLPPTDPRFQAGHELYVSTLGGNVKVDYNAQAGGKPSEDSDHDAF